SPENARLSAPADRGRKGATDSHSPDLRDRPLSYRDQLPSDAAAAHVQPEESIEEGEGQALGAGEPPVAEAIDRSRSELHSDSKEGVERESPTISASNME